TVGPARIASIGKRHRAAAWLTRSGTSADGVAVAIAEHHADAPAARLLRAIQRHVGPAYDGLDVGLSWTRDRDTDARGAAHGALRPGHRGGGDVAQQSVGHHLRPREIGIG